MEVGNSGTMDKGIPSRPRPTVQQSRETLLAGKPWRGVVRRHRMESRRPQTNRRFGNVGTSKGVAKDLQFDAACLPKVETRTGGTVRDLGIVNNLFNEFNLGYAKSTSVMTTEVLHAKEGLFYERPE